MARKLAAIVEEQLIDKELRNWLIPDFSTTTDTDIAVASIPMLATIKKFFTYEAHTGCGFPSVTLHGEQSDWQNLRTRASVLASGTYGADLATWAHLLTPILDHFIATFKSPASDALKEFWLSAVHANPRLSGQTATFSGWITAFAFFTPQGARNRQPRERGMGVRGCELDGVVYPVVRQDTVPSGVVEVGVLVRNYKREIGMRVLAGSVGVEVVEEEGGDGVRPRSGWFMVREW